MKPIIENTAFFGTVVTVPDPQDIVNLTECPDIERLDNIDRLGPAAVLFRNSAFHSNDSVYLPFTNERDQTFLDRLHLMQDQILEVNQKIMLKDIQDIIELVNKNASDDELLLRFADLGANTFAKVFKVDAEFLTKARKMPLVPQMLMPENLFKTGEIIRAHQETDMQAGYDILQLHNPIASTLLTTDLIRRTVKEPNKSVNEIITEISPLQVTLRMTNKSTDLCGLLDNPVPANTIVLYYVGEAAKASGSTAFTFGQGRVGEGARLCPYRKLIIPFLENLRFVADGMQGQPERDPNDPSVYDENRDPL